MVDVHDEPKRRVSQALVAALLVRPLDPALTEDELEDVLIHSGVSQAVAREVVPEMLRDNLRRRGRIEIEANELWAHFRHFEYDYPHELFPLGPVRDLQRAFDELDEIEGKQTSKTLGKLEVRCPHQTSEAVTSALGFMRAVGAVKTKENGYIRVGDFLEQIEPNGHPRTHPWTPHIQQLKVVVERVFAKRSGQLLPTSTPTERFGRFLKKQGWQELAEWWVQTSHELDVLSARQPVAITVLAGSMLEAALTAVAAPAKNAGEWRESWIADAPTTWSLSKMIGQAEKAGTFSAGDAAMAKSVAELRNRIHVGKHAPTWQGPFIPPHTNEHDGRLAKDQLSRLLDSILKWAPVAALA